MGLRSSSELSYYIPLGRWESVLVCVCWLLPLAFCWSSIFFLRVPCYSTKSLEGPFLSLSLSPKPSEFITIALLDPLLVLKCMLKGIGWCECLNRLRQVVRLHLWWVSLKFWSKSLSPCNLKLATWTLISPVLYACFCFWIPTFKPLLQLKMFFLFAWGQAWNKFGGVDNTVFYSF